MIVVQQQITVTELMKEQSLKEKRTKNKSKNSHAWEGLANRSAIPSPKKFPHILYFICCKLYTAQIMKAFWTLQLPFHSNFQLRSSVIIVGLHFDFCLQLFDDIS